MRTRDSCAAVTIGRTELLVDGTDAAFRDLLGDFFAFSQTLEVMRSRFASYIGLSPSQYMVLIVLDRLSGRGHTGINQIAQHLRYSGAFVTIEVNNLVGAGLIEKKQNPTDKRRVVLHVTPKGQACLAKLAGFQRPVNDALFEPLDLADYVALQRIMSRLAANSERAIKIADIVNSQLTLTPTNL